VSYRDVRKKVKGMSCRPRSCYEPESEHVAASVAFSVAKNEVLDILKAAEGASPGRRRESERLRE